MKRKHIVAGAVVGLLALVFAATGKPDFVCKASSSCKEDGLCKGHHFKCVAGSAADCQASEGCRLHGVCSLRAIADSGSRIEEPFCQTGSSADCARSEGCKSDGMCASCTGECRTLEACARAGREEAARNAKFSGLTAQCAKWFAEFDLGTVKDLGDSPDVGGGWTLESDDPDVQALENGSGVTNGRTVSADIVTARFKIWNRTEGKRLQVCVVFAALNDKEFDAWRELAHFRCDDTAGIAGWKKRQTFTEGGPL